MNTHHSNYDETTQVLIVGGGLIGLSTSLFLVKAGIDSLMVERHPGTAIHPRAMGLSPRTMEMFRSAGIEQGIRKVESAFPEGSNVLLMDSLMGQVFDNLQNEGELGELFSGPVPGSAIAQDVLEPVLREGAERLGGKLCFNTELVAFEQDEEGITATLRERESGKTRTVRARFMVAADGSHSKIRESLGIGKHGVESLFHCISIIFEADLMKVFREQHAIMCFLANDEVSGALVPYPGSPARPDLFRLDVTYDPETETVADYPEKRCLHLVRVAVGIPDLPVHIRTVLAYESVALIANRWTDGRIFLVGDAARSQPPSGGLGGNTGIAEAYNLAWKLAAVVNGEAGEELLATYDAERRPLADYTAEQCTLLSEQRRTEGSAGITVDLISINAGYRYSAGDFVPELGEEHLLLAQRPEQWTGQPGTHARRIVLERQGEQISIVDLFGSHFVLLVGAEGQLWKEAAKHVQEELHLPLEVYQIGGEGGDFVDVENMFCEAYGITASGAVIVRPDGFIGWRSRTAKETAQDAEEALTGALSTLLFR